MDIAAHEVHVWHANLRDPALDTGVTSADERTRAARFRTAELRERYQRCRCALRSLLGGFTGQHPARVEFRYNPFGKPMLAGQPWHFNVSHSGDAALIAISRLPVGIDIEALHTPAIDIEGLAPLICHASEKTLLERLSAGERHAMFYRLWTRKEAYCKAVGVGLQRALPSLRLEMLTGDPAIVGVTDEDAPGGDAYFVHDLHAPAGYTASLCVPAARPVIHMHSLVPSVRPRGNARPPPLA